MFDSIKAACTTRNLLIGAGIVAVGAAVAYYFLSDDNDAGAILEVAAEGAVATVETAVDAAVATVAAAE